MAEELTETVRAMWLRFEPVHAVTYFAPQARYEYEQVGLRGYWRGYFAGRAAPFGRVGAGPVYAAFYGFHPAMVAKALPDVWNRADPAAVLGARLDGARQALSAVLDGVIDDETLRDASDLLKQAALGADVAGRPLAGANADLPWPHDAIGVLWQAATVLREHRGDGHVASLLVAGLDGLESLVLRSALDDTRSVMQPNRGWSDEEWTEAAQRLAERGLLDADGEVTPAGREAYATVEEDTDRLAAGPWRRLGAQRTELLATLLTPISTAAARYLPQPSPIGLPPRGD